MDRRFFYRVSPASSELARTDKSTKSKGNGDRKDSEEEMDLPQKKHFRQRAHANPLADHTFDYPVHVSEMTERWKAHYPQMADTHKVEMADIGCGYGGLMRMEIRVKVQEYVNQRIQALRERNIQDKKAAESGSYQNVSVMRMNAMKYCPNFFEKGQARIITSTLVSEYAYILRPEGKLYTCTDVKDLHEWMVQHLDAHPLFRRLTAEECEADPCVPCVMNDTEEGIKVARNKGDKYLAVYERLAVPRVDGKDWDGFDPMLSLVQPKDGKKEDEEDDKADR